MNSLASNADARADIVRRLVIVSTAAALLLWVSNSSSRGQEAPAARPVVTATATAQPTQDFVDVLKLEAERSEQATRHEIGMVEQTLTTFTWIVGVVGAIISGVSAALFFLGLGSLRDIRRRAEITIQTEIKKLTNEADTKITQEVQKQANEANTKIDTAVNSVRSAFEKEIAELRAEFSARSNGFREEIAKMTQVT